MKIVLASDHAGFSLKEEIKKHLTEKNIAHEDIGVYSGESVDYPLQGRKAAELIAEGAFDRGIIICGTGIGISIAANKVKGVRAAAVSDTFSARMSRMHNDANMLALGGRVVGIGLALEIVDTWLSAEFEGGRHKKRIDMIELE